MDIGIYLTGPFGQSQPLYEANNRLKRIRESKKPGDITLKKDYEQAVMEVIEKDTATIIAMQKDLNLDYIIDPQFNLEYLFQSFVKNVDGVEEGPQENWFNNNVFYRVPEIKGPLRSQPGFTDTHLLTEHLVNGGNFMAILPSPFSLHELSHVTGYDDRQHAIENLAVLIKDEAQHLADNGFKRIQYDEPAIVVGQPPVEAEGVVYTDKEKQRFEDARIKFEEDKKLLGYAMDIVGQIRGATTMLHTYFGDAGPIIPYLLTLKVGGIGIDGTETGLDIILSNDFNGKELALGLVDARTSFMENPQSLSTYLNSIEEATHPKKLYLTPNTATEYIGFTYAKEKMRRLNEIKGMLNG